MRLVRLVVAALSIAALGASAAAAADEAIPAADRIRLAEAFRVAAEVGDSLWSGWGAAPFAILLVTPDQEFLIRHPAPPSDFRRVGYDSLLRSDVFVRKRTFPTSFLATFPAFDATPTIVVGEAELTRKSSAAWVLVLLHEHFHQLQYSRPDYQPGVTALGLAHGDKTGMWMLNYPFPYDSSAVRSSYDGFASGLADAIAASAPKAGPVVEARGRLVASVTAEQYRYLAFQLWQEGVARYTELSVGRRAAAGAGPGAAFRALPDYTTYALEAAKLEHGIRSGVVDADLGKEKRVSFYACGAAYALLLDQVAAGWRARYFEVGFSLDPLLQ